MDPGILRQVARPAVWLGATENLTKVSAVGGVLAFVFTMNGTYGFFAFALLQAVMIALTRRDLHTPWLCRAVVWQRKVKTFVPVAQGWRYVPVILLMAGAAALAPGRPAGAAFPAIVREPALWQELFGWSGILLGASVLLALAVGKPLRRLVVPRPFETRLSELIQLESVWKDDRTIETKDGALLQVVRLAGLDVGGFSKEERDALKNRRHHWFMSLARAGVQVKILTLREPVRFEAEARFENGVLQEIHDRWMESFERIYETRHYIVITAQKGARAGKLLHEAVQAVLERLHPFGPEVLTLGDTGHSPLLGFWGLLINGFHRPVMPARGDLANRLTTSIVHFGRGDGSMEIRDGAEVLYGRVLSLKSWSEQDSPLLLQRLMALQGRVQILQCIEPIDRQGLLPRLTLEKRQRQLMFLNVTAGDEFETAQELLSSETEEAFQVQLNLYLFAEEMTELEELTTVARQVFGDFGHVSAIADQTDAWHWNLRLGGFDAQIRPTRLMAGNLASLNSFPAEPVGLSKSDWGEGAIRLFRTVTGGAYQFQFHASARAEEVAHSVTFAPSGSGKTTLMQHLVGGALRHPDLAAYMFDRYAGTQIFTEAAGGSFINLVSADDVTLNPLQMEATNENRAFLVRWLKQIAGVNPNDEASNASAERAVDVIFKIANSRRSLRGVYESAFDTGTVLKSGLKRWTVAHGVGKTFNGKTDSLDLSMHRLVTFEMAGLFEDERLASAVVSYIMHRIRSACRREGRAHLVIVDETAALLQDEGFKGELLVMLREHRRLRGSINLVFQDVGAMIQTGIGEAILNQCPTVFIFPNPNAREDDYRVLDLTEVQWAFVKGQGDVGRHLKHPVLMKRGREAVFLDIDLMPMGELLQLYRSGADAVQRMRKLKKERGVEWIDAYLEDWV